ncbi:MAG TPA: hypothetical protein VMY06_14800 [Sedimentisphaerales bacterium]|nr:hypothetical protein [Sedimentisphaerales bacterium]HUU15589.1 hypothetical protein [Sedimentisphaerales bacterium]
MSNLDRFACGYTPKIPVEVGSCEACGGVIYDYELEKCESCDTRIHKGCVEFCDVCSSPGCKCCIKEDPDDDGLLKCEACRPEPENDRPATLVDVGRAATEKLS